MPRAPTLQKKTTVVVEEDDPSDSGSDYDWDDDSILASDTVATQPQTDVRACDYMITINTNRTIFPNRNANAMERALKKALNYSGGDPSKNEDILNMYALRLGRNATDEGKTIDEVLENAKVSHFTWETSSRGYVHAHFFLRITYNSKQNYYVNPDLSSGQGFRDFVESYLSEKFNKGKKLYVNCVQKDLTAQSVNYLKKQFREQA